MLVTRNGSMNHAPADVSADGAELLQKELRQLVRLQEATLDLWDTLSYNPSHDLRWRTSDVLGDPWQAGLVYQEDRKRGDLLPVYLSEEQLREIRFRSRQMCYHNEFARCGVENRINYVVGDGFTYSVLPLDNDDKRAVTAAERAQDIVDLFCEVNNMPAREADAMWRLDADGEFFLRLFPDDRGILHVRNVEPEHVRSPSGGKDERTHSYGKETDPFDIECTKGYWVVENPDVSWTPKLVDAEEIVHGKINVPIVAKRGCPTYHPVFANLRRCEELLQSMSHMAKVRAKLALIIQMTGVTSSAAEALMAKLTVTQASDSTTGKSINVGAIPPGTALGLPKGVEVISNHPQIGASDFVDVLQAELRAIASRLQMPEWMFTALPDAKYSNAFVVEAPTLRSFTRLQRTLTDLFGNSRYHQRASLVWRQLYHAVRCGLLPREALTLIRVECKGPSLETRDKHQEAATAVALVNARLSSKKQQIQELGRDPDETADQIAAETQGTYRPVTDMREVVAVQGQYYGGQLPKPAAVALVRLILGFGQEQAEALFPGEPTPQPQAPPPGAGPGPSTGGQPQGSPADAGADTGPASGGGGADGGSLASIFSTEQVAADLLEAGFTGSIRDSIGREYHFEDGRRVAGSSDAADAATGKGFASLKSGPETIAEAHSSNLKEKLRKVLAGVKSGRLKHDEAKQQIDAHLQKIRFDADRAIRLRHGALRADMAHRFGEENLDTPEWHAVEYAMNGFHGTVVDSLEDMADYAKKSVDHHQKHGELNDDAADDLKYSHQAVTNAAGKYYDTLIPKINAFKQKHAASFREQYDHAGELGTRVELHLLEAGFTGRVVDRIGRVYYYVDGKRVKRGDATQVHGGNPQADMIQARSAVQKARDLHKLATESPHLLTPEHLAELPGLLSAVPVHELKKMAAAFNAATGGKLKDEHVAGLAKLFPVPAGVAALMQQTPHGSAYLDRLKELDGATIESTEKIPESKIDPTEDLPPSMVADRKRAARDDSDSIGRERAAAAKQGKGDLPLTFIPHPKERDDETTILVDPKKLDASFAKDESYYLPPDGEGKSEIRGRRKAAEEFISSGKPIQASRVSLGTDGEVAFEDGRHRFAVLRDSGVDAVAVTVPKEQAGEFKKKFGVDAGATSAKLDTESSKAEEEPVNLTVAPTRSGRSQATGTAKYAKVAGSDLPKEPVNTTPVDPLKLEKLSTTFAEHNNLTSDEREAFKQKVRDARSVEEVRAINANARDLSADRKGLSPKFWDKKYTRKIGSEPEKTMDAPSQSSKPQGMPEIKAVSDKQKAYAESTRQKLLKEAGSRLDAIDSERYASLNPQAKQKIDDIRAGHEFMRTQAVDAKVWLDIARNQYGHMFAEDIGKVLRGQKPDFDGARVFVRANQKAQEQK